MNCLLMQDAREPHFNGGCYSAAGAIFGEIGDQIFVTVLVLIGEQVIGRRVVVGFVPGSETLVIDWAHVGWSTDDVLNGSQVPL